MLRNFISTLTEGRYGQKVHEFRAAELSKDDRSRISFIVNEKAGQKQLVLVLEADEGHEIEREYCNVDAECLADLERLIAEVKAYSSGKF